MNAVALYSTAFNFARIVGPAIAGFMMAGFGIGVCYLFNSCAFLSVVCGLFLIKKQGDIHQRVSHTVISDIRDGLHYVLDKKQLRDILFVTAVMGIFAINYSVLLPVLAIKVLGQQEVGFGFSHVYRWYWYFSRCFLRLLPVVSMVPKRFFHFF